MLTVAALCAAGCWQRDNLCDGKPCGPGRICVSGTCRVVDAGGDDGRCCDLAGPDRSAGLDLPWSDGPPDSATTDGPQPPDWHLDVLATDLTAP